MRNQKEIPTPKTEVGKPKLTSFPYLHTNLFRERFRDNFLLEARDKMTEFWEEHSRDACIEEMMLDSHAEELTKYELPEILSYLPD